MMGDGPRTGGIIFSPRVSTCSRRKMLNYFPAFLYILHCAGMADSFFRFPKDCPVPSTPHCSSTVYPPQSERTSHNEPRPNDLYFHQKKSFPEQPFSVQVNDFNCATSSFNKKESITDAIKMLTGYSVKQSIFIIRCCPIRPIRISISGEALSLDEHEVFSAAPD